MVLLFGLWPFAGGDLFMPLTVGRWTWEHAAVPYPAVFSSLTPDAPLIAHSWPAGLVFSLLHPMTGMIGFAVLRFALTVAALTTMARTDSVG